MACKLGHRRPYSPHVPNPDYLINSSCSNHALVILVPVASQNFMFVTWNHDTGSRISDVPNSNGAVTGRGSEDIGVSGRPGGGVDAVGMLFERTDADVPVHGPEL